MPEFSVKDVILAALAGQYLSPSSRQDSRAISLITGDRTNLGLTSIEKIESLLKYVEQSYQVRLKIIGGGRGCTKIDLEVHGSPESAVEFVSRLLEDRKFSALAREIGFRIIYSPGSIISHQIPEPLIGKQSTVSVNINNSTVGNLQLDSEGSKILNGSKNFIDPEWLEILIATMHSTLRSTNIDSDQEVRRIAQEIEVLKLELQGQSPRKEIVAPILSNLGGVASLAALADQVHKFLPKF